MEAETNGIIDLSAQGLANPLALKPLIKTLNYQSSVNTLILSNCQLHRSSDVFKMICTLMPTLDNLHGAPFKFPDFLNLYHISHIGYTNK